ncbi:MAG: flippase-like domain-containing protein [Anaerolineales bacterium]|nr:flippase-like domain-containing protein [Anaerolineales bacterium]
MIEALKLADYRLILVAVTGGVVWLLVRGVAWRTLLQNKATYDQVFFTVNEGYLLNNVLPFRLGEVARAFLLSYKARLSFWEVLPTIVIERVLDLAFAVGLLLATLPFVVEASGARQLAFGSSGVVVVGLLFLYLLARYRVRAIELFNRLGQRWPLLLKLGGHSITSLFDGLAVLTDWRRFLLSVFWIMLNWLIAFGQYYLFLRAFVPEAQAVWAGFTLGAAALGFAAPSSPGAVGVFELVVVGVLALFNIDPATALGFALITHFSQYFLVAILGTVGLARDGESLVGLYNRVRRMPSH